MIRRTRLRPVSAKRRKASVEWARVKRLVRLRAGGRCEVTLCQQKGTDPHHIEKRWRTGLVVSPDRVIWLCRRHHDQTDAPYSKGRLVIEAKGGGRFTTTMVRKADKWAAPSFFC